jgi:hypothetical protein
MCLRCELRCSLIAHFPGAITQELHRTSRAPSSLGFHRRSHQSIFWATTLGEDEPVTATEAILKVLETLATLGWPAVAFFGLWKFGRPLFDAVANAINRHGLRFEHGETKFEALPQKPEPPVDTTPARLEQIEVAQEAVGVGTPTVTQTAPPTPAPTPTPTPEPPGLEHVSKASLAEGMVHWHAMYLSAFLQPHTIGVLLWLEENGATSKSDLREIWRPTISDFQEFEAVLVALESNQLIELAGPAIQVTAKARNFLAWRTRAGFYPTLLSNFELAPKPTRR